MFVTVEGIDGAGKTTVVDRLGEELSDVETVFTREPTGSWIGEDVGRALRDDTTDALADLFLFVADHADHLDRVVRPAIEGDADVVVCDRYVDSRVAYQGATLGDHEALDGVDDVLGWVRGVHEPWTVDPDLTILLDLPVEEAMERVEGDAKYERADLLGDVAENYRRLAEDERFVTVDASRGIEEVVDDCVAVLRDRL